ncbi:MAG: hypothetical protein LPL29_03910 [Alphaproteobacteria bacterium]|nr:hypothetical protein [Alphaproteobacteria bacterium]
MLEEYDGTPPGSVIHLSPLVAADGGIAAFCRFNAFSGRLVMTSGPAGKIVDIHDREREELEQVGFKVEALHKMDEFERLVSAHSASLGDEFRALLSDALKV